MFPSGPIVSMAIDCSLEHFLQYFPKRILRQRPIAPAVWRIELRERPLAVFNRTRTASFGGHSMSTRPFSTPEYVIWDR